MKCDCMLQQLCPICEKWKLATYDKESNKWIPKDNDKPIKFHEFYIEPKDQMIEITNLDGSKEEIKNRRRTENQNKHMLMIHTRIDGVEHKVYAPITRRK